MVESGCLNDFLARNTLDHWKLEILNTIVDVIIPTVLCTKTAITITQNLFFSFSNLASITKGRDFHDTTVAQYDHEPKQTPTAIIHHPTWQIQKHA